MAVKKTKTKAAKPKSKTTVKKAPAKKTSAAKKAPAKKTSAAASKTKNTNAKLNSNNAQLADLISAMESVRGAFKVAAHLSENLTSTERRRLISAGVRNYGFIEKALDIARDNQQYLPPNFSINDFSNNLTEFDQIRQFYLVAEKIQTLAFDAMLLKSNELYREALRFYNSLREQARGRVAGAKDLFNALEPFFKRRRVSESEPTIKEELRRSKGIIKGTVNGEMFIKNQKPKMTGGVHKVVEDIHKDIIEGKETAEFSETK